MDDNRLIESASSYLSEGDTKKVVPKINEEYEVYLSSSSDYFQAMLDDVKITFANKGQFGEWTQQMGLTLLNPQLYQNDKQYIHLVGDRKFP